jgi:hypothetical protein
MIKAAEGFDVPPNWKPRFDAALPDADGVTWGPYKQRITTRVEISRKNPKGSIQPFSGVALLGYRWGMGPKFVAEVYSTIIKGYPCIYYLFQHVGKESEPPLVKLFLFPTLGRWGYEEREDFKGLFTMQIEVDHRRGGSIVEAWQIDKIHPYSDGAAATIEWWNMEYVRYPLTPLTFYSGDKIIGSVGEHWYEHFDKPPVGHWLIRWETGMITFRSPESFAKDFTLQADGRYATAGRPLFA